jgi:hypothetical protein
LFKPLQAKKGPKIPKTRLPGVHDARDTSCRDLAWYIDPAVILPPEFWSRLSASVKDKVLHANTAALFHRRHMEQRLRMELGVDPNVPIEVQCKCISLSPYSLEDVY